MTDSSESQKVDATVRKILSISHDELSRLQPRRKAPLKTWALAPEVRDLRSIAAPELIDELLTRDTRAVR